jgi:ABC-type thiamine transport system substrate-binding protein
MTDDALAPRPAGVHWRVQHYNSCAVPATPANARPTRFTRLAQPQESMGADTAAGVDVEHVLDEARERRLGAERHHAKLLDSAATWGGLRVKARQAGPFQRTAGLSLFGRSSH